MPLKISLSENIYNYTLFEDETDSQTQTGVFSQSERFEKSLVKFGFSTIKEGVDTRWE